MRRRVFGRGLSVALAIMMAASMLAGCGKDGTENPPSGIESVQSSAQESTGGSSTSAGDLAGEAVNSSQGAELLLASLKTSFAAAKTDTEYEKPLYNVACDHVFSFPCSEKAGYIAFDAFKVYDTPDFERAMRSYNWNTYEDGVIKVAPNGVVQLSEEGSRDVNNGTWGSLNQLYLVQYLDLETGEKLEKPVVTPFTVEHSVKSPFIRQDVDDENNYLLKWDPVEGAAKYVVYEYYGNAAYDVACVTEGTEVSVKEFERQKKSEELSALFKQDLMKEGYQVDTEGVAFMNTGVKYSNYDDAGFFLVIAIDGAGNASGISNLVDVQDVAHMLPYRVPQAVVQQEISELSDIPAYVDVEMIDGSTTQMIIDYHGAQAYKYPDDGNKITIRAKVANTGLDSFMITLTGMKYEEVVQGKDYFLSREDELLSKVIKTEVPVQQVEITEEETPGDGTIPGGESSSSESGSSESESVSESAQESEVSSEPESSEASEISSEPESSEASVASSEPESSEASVASSEPESSEAGETSSEQETPAASESAGGQQEGVSSDSIQVQLFNEIAGTVNNNLNLIGKDKVDKVLYANSDLAAWMSYCLIAQSDVIPVPEEVFGSVANDLNYTTKLLMECYRQNPTCGLIDFQSAKYNSQYQAYVVPYIEDREQRFNKTIQEINKAVELSETLVNSSDSDYEKVLKINDFFRESSSYDYDSCSTDVDIHNLSEQFLDAHAPYGIICNQYGVCESYSEAFALTARAAGLEAICETGTMFGGGHEWNRVKVEGSWCVLDVTNNDQEAISNALFNLSEEQMEGILVPDGSCYLDREGHLALTNRYEYYNSIEAVADSAEDVKAKILSMLAAGDEVRLRVPEAMSQDEVLAILIDMKKEGTLHISDAKFAFHVLYLKK